MRKSETASDATNIFGIVRNRRFSSMTRSVTKFPTNISNERNPKETDSKMTFSLLLDFSSVNMSASCFSVESIFCSFSQIDSLPAAEEKTYANRVSDGSENVSSCEISFALLSSTIFLNCYHSGLTTMITCSLKDLIYELHVVDPQKQHPYSCVQSVLAADHLI